MFDAAAASAISLTTKIYFTRIAPPKEQPMTIAFFRNRLAYTIILVGEFQITPTGNFVACFTGTSVVENSTACVFRQCTFRDTTTRRGVANFDIGKTVIIASIFR